MNANRKKQVGLLLLVIVIAGLLAMVSGAQADPLVSPLSPDEAWYGKTYDEWAADWWQWAAALPADESHPLFADGEMDCSLGQKGKVWFLGGTYAESGVAHRSCEVPAGKALFFPIVNVLCSPFTGDDPDALLECAAAPPVPRKFEFQMTPLAATIEGEAIDNLEDFYTLSDETFSLGPLPEPNIFDAEPGEVGLGATGGYYILLPPLNEGEWEITFAGEIVVLKPNHKPAYYFKTDISYNLTVVDDDV